MRLCAWCQDRPLTDSRSVFCSQRCRQAAFRLRRRRTTEATQGRPMVMAYADPPYPGLSSKYYRDEPSFAGEVDHEELIASLRSSTTYDGWALSTSAKALRDVLPLCPTEARVCSWVKPIGACPRTFGVHNTWEALIVVPGRSLRPGVRDWLRAQPARFGGELPGRKPIAFWGWLFDLLGMVPGDTFVDLFPGTGLGGRAWRYLSSTPALPVVDAEPSPAARADASPKPRGDGSSGPSSRADQTSLGAAPNASPGDDNGPGPSDTSQGYQDDMSSEYSANERGAA